MPDMVPLVAIPAVAILLSENAVLSIILFGWPEALMETSAIVPPAGKSAGGRSANGPSFAIRKVTLVSKTGFGLDSCETVP